MRGKDKDASALAPAAICRKPLRGSFMTLPDELECLRKCRWHLRTKYRRIARPPKTESLPLIAGNVGMFRGQLCNKDTLIPFSQGGVQCRLATSSEMPALLVYVGYWGKIGKHMLNASSSHFDPT